MTGPDHYREAEERMVASDYQRQNTAAGRPLDDAMHEVAMAQVHATLALAAATAFATTERYFEDSGEANAWDTVAGVQP